MAYYFLLLIVPAFLLAYNKPILLIFMNPYSYHFSHGILILGIIFYMVWSQRRTLQNIVIRPSIITGTAVSFMGSIILVVGIFSETVIVEGIALVVGVAGITLLLLGKDHFKALIFPIFYIGFSFPLFDKILANFSIQFENIAAHIARYFLSAWGIPVLLKDNILTLPHISLNVVQACNGINHVIALVALVLFLGYVEKYRPWQTLLSVVFAVFIGISINGLRVGLIGLWTMHFGTVSFHGPFDIFYSTFVFSVGIFVLLALSRIIRKINKKEIKFEIANITDKKRIECDNRFRTIASCIALTILLMTTAYIAYAKPVRIAVMNDMVTLPLEIAHWRGTDTDNLGHPFDLMTDFDTILKRVYVDDKANKALLFIGYINAQKQGREIHSYPDGILVDDAANGGMNGSVLGTMTLKRGADRAAGNLQTAIYYYWINGRVYNHRYKAKLASMYHSILSGRNNAALVIISFEPAIHNDNTESKRVDIAFLNQLMQAVDNCFKTNNTISQ